MMILLIKKENQRCSTHKLEEGRGISRIHMMINNCQHNRIKILMRKKRNKITIKKRTMCYQNPKNFLYKQEKWQTL